MHISYRKLSPFSLQYQPLKNENVILSLCIPLYRSFNFYSSVKVNCDIANQVLKAE